MHKFCINIMICVLGALAMANQPSADEQRLYDESGQYQIDIQDSVVTCLQKVQTWQEAHHNRHDAKSCYVGVFDIDETLLSNIELIRESHYNFTLNDFLEFVPNSHPTAIAPTVKLLHAMQKAGMRIILITGRTESICTQTRKQLSAAGIGPQDYDALYCGPDIASSDGNFKESVRMQIEAEGCKVAFNVSDQPADLRGRAAGQECLLPNPFYTV